MKKHQLTLIIGSIIFLIVQGCSPKYTASFQPPVKKSQSNKSQIVAQEMETLTDATSESSGNPVIALPKTNDPIIEKKSSVQDRAREQHDVDAPMTSMELSVLQEVRENISSMSRLERKQLMDEAKLQVETLRAEGDDRQSTDLLLLVIIAILIPPLAMILYENGVTGRFWISLLLTLLFYVPGLIYTLVVILGGK